MQIGRAGVRRRVRSRDGQPSVVAEHIRGSSLLLAGRIAAYGLEFVAQVLLVRYLAKADFGAFSFALAVVVALKSIAVLELPNTLARFIPIYRERGSYAALMGSIALGVGTILSLGALMAAVVHVASQTGVRITDDPASLLLLSILVLLIPLEGLDALITTLFATFDGAKQIAFRQVLAPALKLGVVVVLMLLGADAEFLAAGYVGVAGLSLLIYGWMLVRLLAGQPWIEEWQPRRFDLPLREIFGFALPLLTSTLVWLLMESSDAVLLGIFQNTEAVASFRAVLPVPRVLTTLTLTFGVLYTPLASRLYAQFQHAELADLYRRTALWMTVLCFPIFALAFGFARSTTVGLYGDNYADSAPIMALLSLGYYFFAVTGFNGLTLKIYKKLRYAVGVDIAAAILNVIVNLILIPRWGAPGAAIGTAGTLIVHNALKQYGLWKYLRLNLFEARYVWTFAVIFLVGFVLLGLQALLPASLWLAIPISTVASLFVLAIAWKSLEIETMFPEIRRVPFAASLLRRLPR